VCHIAYTASGVTHLTGLLFKHKELLDRGLRVLLYSERQFDFANYGYVSYLAKLLGFRKELVDILREVLLGFQHLFARHGGAGRWCKYWAAASDGPQVKAVSRERERAVEVGMRTGKWRVVVGEAPVVT
jgi:hypothetical protein